MPLALGGVVDEEMRVYGTQNLRVVDSSSESAHFAFALNSR